MKEMTPTERKKKLDALMSKQNREAKHKVLGYADELSNRYILRRPCGILPLDIQTVGGLPAATSNIIAGPDGSGKTYLMYQYMVMNQRIHGANSAIAIAPVEHPFDHMYCRYKGLMVVVPDMRIDQEQEFRKSMGWPQLTKDEIKFLKVGVGEVVPIVGNNMEEMMDQTLSCVATDAFQIIGVDSITAAMPKDLADKDLDENTMMGRHARILGDFYRKYGPYTTGFEGAGSNRSDTTLIFTQQVRSNKRKAEAPAFMAKYMKEWDGTGSSNAGKHHKVIEITVWGGAKIREKGADAEDKKKVQTGKVLNWEITKGKAGCHEGMTGEVEFDFTTGVNMQQTVLSSGIMHGTLTEKNGLIYIMDSLTKKPHPKFEAMAKPAGEFIKFLAGNWDAEEYVRKATVYASTGCACLYR